MDGNHTSSPNAWEFYREQVEHQGTDTWPEPQPMTVQTSPQPYPLEALPGAIRAAVTEVQGFTKAPLPLVASSALAALSLAGQSLVDVRRAERLNGPSGLFLLSIADSGERKTTCDGFFAAAIRDYEREQSERAQPDMKSFRADLAAWEAKRAGLLESIRQTVRKGRDTADMESSLRAMEERKPQPPRVPRLFYGDTTPEALTWSLANTWPSGGVISSEAGSILGSSGMGKDSIMRNLAVLNELWDGKPLTFDRRKEGGSFTVRGARLTMALQVQEATLRSFFDRSNGLARGTGFLARFLIAWPESTQGSRPFSDPPDHWPYLAMFHRGISDVLNTPPPIDGSGALSPVMLEFHPQAKRAWIDFHDGIETELKSGGNFFDVRDVASKAADNAARLAALFHVFQFGTTGTIDADTFGGASQVVVWHLGEARRFFGELAMPEELMNAARLDAWLVEYCRKECVGMVPRRVVQRCGPNSLRDRARLESSLRELSDLDRVKQLSQGHRKEILINPALLGRYAI